MKYAPTIEFSSVYPMPRIIHISNDSIFFGGLVVNDEVLDRVEKHFVNQKKLGLRILSGRLDPSVLDSSIPPKRKSVIADEFL